MTLAILTIYYTILFPLSLFFLSGLNNKGKISFGVSATYAVFFAILPIAILGGHQYLMLLIS
ncbi:hypothetical protein [Halobacillus faecis]|uniref:Uncharacterized protein n=1 Tax=Halobacillus faecis TaxID=360184 RepID=A0A511WYE6_9BACI|nr:hypothetical protein [Halobacillus faecis]GEN55503.1 hypothetical protein HFA01_37650 [Halobacillus faecis]